MSFGTKISLLIIITFAIFLLYMYLNRPFVNKDNAHIKIYINELLFADIHNVEPGEFEYYLKENPRRLNLRDKDTKLVSIFAVEDDNKKIKVDIDYYSNQYTDLIIY